MVESIGLASGLPTLANFAFQSSITLNKTVQSFQFHPKRVRDLKVELEALSEILGSLTETVSATTDVDLFALNLPLLRCGNACKEFEQEIMKCLSRSGDSRTSFRDWTKLRYMGDDIDGFRQLLAGYKSTISIALAHANLRESSITAESLDTYRDLIETATIDLEAHLQIIDNKLDSIFRQRGAESGLEATEPRLIKDEQQMSIQESIQVPTQLSDYTYETQLIPERSKSSRGHTETDTLPGRFTIEGLQESKNSLTLTAEKLERHMKDLIDRLETKFKAVTTSEEDLTDLVRLREEWDVTRQCLEICTKAYMHIEEDISNIDDHTTADAAQVMVSTDGKTIPGRNRRLGWRTRQVGGHLSDASVQSVLRDMLSNGLQNTGSDSPPSLGNTPSVHDEGLSHKPGSEFIERYGQGYKLSSLHEKKWTTEADPSAPETAPSSKIAGQDKTSYHPKADTESLGATDLESVFSDFSTISSAASTGILEISATWELIELLLSHDILHSLYELAIRKVTAEKFERHLRGFLRAYADGLKTEAQNEAQIRASNFVRQSVRRTAREIKLAMLKPMESQMDQSSSQRDVRRERLNLWLESAQKLQATNTGDSDSESDKSNDKDMLIDDNRLYNLNEVKNFLTSSRAFVTLCQSLRSWLRMQERDVTAEMKPLVAPAGETTQSMHNDENLIDIVDDMTMWSSLWFWLMALCYPPPAGFKRIPYICGCAQYSYVDVRELSPGGIHRFRQRLIQSANAVRTALHRRGRTNHTTSLFTSSMASKHIPTVGVPFSQPSASYKQSFSISEMHLDSLQPHIQSIPEDQDTPEDQDISESHNILEDRDIPMDQDTSAEQVATQNQDPPEGQDPPPQYLHLCINRKGVPIMSAVEVSCLHNDQYLFQTISREYRRVRGQYEWRISLLVPSLVWKLSCTVFAPLTRFMPSLVGLNSIQQLFHTISQCHLHNIGSGDFVQFQLIPVREECCPGWFKTKSFPPVDEVLKKRYLYAPVPMEDVELLDIPLSHLLKPGPHTDIFWMMTIPKKLGQPLIRQPGMGGQRVIGWGIRINECLNWVVILCSMLVLLVVIGVSVIVYAAITSDKSSAFGLGAYLVATFTIYISYQYFAWKAD